MRSYKDIFVNEKPKRFADTLSCKNIFLNFLIKIKITYVRHHRHVFVLARQYQNKTNCFFFYRFPARSCMYVIRKVACHSQIKTVGEETANQTAVVLLDRLTEVNVGLRRLTF